MSVKGVSFIARRRSATCSASGNLPSSMYERPSHRSIRSAMKLSGCVFRDFLKTHPDSFIADLMLLWLGRSYIELGKFPEAEQVAERLRAMKDTPFTDIYKTELSAG